VVNQPRKCGIEQDIIAIIFNTLQANWLIPTGQHSRACVILR